MLGYGGTHRFETHFAFHLNVLSLTKMQNQGRTFVGQGRTSKPREWDRRGVPPPPLALVGPDTDTPN